MERIRKSGEIFSAWKRGKIVEWKGKVCGEFRGKPCRMVSYFAQVVEISFHNPPQQIPHRRFSGDANEPAEMGFFLSLSFPHAVETDVENRSNPVDSLLERASGAWKRTGKPDAVLSAGNAAGTALKTEICRGEHGSPGNPFSVPVNDYPRSNSRNPFGGIARFSRCPPWACKRFCLPFLVRAVLIFRVFVLGMVFALIQRLLRLFLFCFPVRN